MGMNWGAFGGAMAQSALSTYERLEDQKLKQLQRSQLEKDIAEKEALDQAWRESQARVGQQDEYGQAIKTEGFTGTQQAKMLSDQGALQGNTPEDQAFERASAEAAAGALRENAVAKGAIPEAKAALPELRPTEYTAKQGMQDYVKAAGQVSRKGTIEALQLKNVVRESDIQDKFDTEQQKLNDTLALIHGTAESGGLKGLADAATKEGLKVKFVEGKNGVGSRIQVLGPKGDVLETVSDVNSATEKLSQAAMQQFYNKGVSILGSPDKVLAFMQGEKKLAIAQQEANTKDVVGRAQAGYYGAAAANMNAKANTAYEKLPEKDKFRLNSLNTGLQTAVKAHEANPTPEGEFRVGVAQLKLNKAMKEKDMLDGSVYDGTGIPSPQDAANQIINAKITNQADIDKRLNAAKLKLGNDYADEVRIALEENKKNVVGTPKAPAPGVKSALKQPVFGEEISSALPTNKLKGIKAFGSSEE